MRFKLLTIFMCTLCFTATADQSLDQQKETLRELIEFHTQQCDKRPSSCEEHIIYIDYYTQILEYLEMGWEIK